MGLMVVEGGGRLLFMVVEGRVEGRVRVFFSFCPVLVSLPLEPFVGSF